jgi:hypothetical protein
MVNLGCEDDTAVMQLKVAQIGPLLPPPQRRTKSQSDDFVFKKSL